MAILEDPQHEIFAQLRTKGVTIDQAYVDAGFKKNRSNASRLNSKEHIQARIAELTERLVEKHDVTMDSILSELEEARELALKDEKGASAAVSATMGKAKLCGLIVDKKEDVTARRTNEQIDARINEILGLGNKDRAVGTSGRKETTRKRDKNSPTVPGHGTA